MSTTDELAAKLAAAGAQQDMIDDHLRAVAFNATLEAMDVHGRSRFTVEDSRMANSIFRILSHAKPANIHKDDIGLVPSAQVTADGTVQRIARVTKIGDRMDELKTQIEQTNAVKVETTSPVPQSQQVAATGEAAVAAAVAQGETQ